MNIVAEKKKIYIPKKVNVMKNYLIFLYIYTHRLDEMADITRTNNRLKENIDTKDEKIISLEQRLAKYYFIQLK